MMDAYGTRNPWRMHMSSCHVNTEHEITLTVSGLEDSFPLMGRSFSQHGGLFVWYRRHLVVIVIGCWWLAKRAEGKAMYQSFSEDYATRLVGIIRL
jgi:hypothetical protein